MSKVLYSVLETCDALCIGRSRFYQLVKFGEIHPVKLGRKTVVTKTEIDRFVASLEALTRGDS
jgi:excisionase family DNA binding protein